jgi:hypothetical protein
MTVYGYKNIKDQIVTVLNTVTGIAVVYAKEAKALGSYPAATVEAKGHANKFSSIGVGGVDERTYQHIVRLYFRTDEANDPDYEDILEGLADTMQQAFDNNITLNGACNYAILTGGSWRYGTKESPVRIAEFTVTSVVRIQRGTGALV